jgi:hypothetical protein
MKMKYRSSSEYAAKERKKKPNKQKKKKSYEHQRRRRRRKINVEQSRYEISEEYKKNGKDEMKTGQRCCYCQNNQDEEE